MKAFDGERIQQCEANDSLPHKIRHEERKLQKKLWLGLFIMALLSPIGIVLPEKFGAEDAWGEWGVDALEKLLGYVPEGLKKTADIWMAPIPDYAFGKESALFSNGNIAYILSGILGIILTSIAMIGISKILFRHER